MEPKSPVGKRVLVISPKVALPKFKFGSPKFGWLKISNASARNSEPMRSVILVTLISEKSVSTKLGPMIVFRPSLPAAQARVAPEPVHGDYCCPAESYSEHPARSEVRRECLSERAGALPE